MKKSALVILILSGFLLSGCWGKGTEEVPTENEEQMVEPTPTPPETELPAEERPTISFVPNEEMTEVEIEITDLPDDVKSIDYELAYKTEGLNQGFIGTYNVGKGPVTRTLGTCSSGVCRYDKDITDMVLTIKYRSNGERILLRERL